MENMKNISLLAILLIIFVIMSPINCTGIKEKNAIRRSEIIKIDFKKVRDGEYTGEYNENINSARVLVSIKDKTIQKIKILKHHHGPGHGAGELIEKIIKEQTLEVDCVTGATKSSYVLKKALENALRQGL